MAKLSGFTDADYLAALRRLLPPGPAWDDYEAEPFATTLWLAAREFARLDADIARLIEEADPRTAGVTLSQWLYEWGVPDACLASLPDATLAQWRQVLVTKIRSLGITFTELLQILADISGVESAHTGSVDPFTVESTVNARVYGHNWDSAVLIISAVGGDRQYFRTDWAADERLSRWGNDLWECLVREFAPCHLVIVFVYESSEESAS